MKPSLVSVVVPVYNRAHLLRECVESVLSQTHRPVELVLVDDGSSDESYVMMERLANENKGRPGVRFVLARQKNGGAPKARNKGSELASGDWVQFLDSDDIILPNKIKTALEMAEAHDAEVVYSRAQFVDANGFRVPKYWGRKLTCDWRDYFEFSWQTMCAIYSRKSLQKIGLWNEGLVISQDWEFCIRTIVSGVRICYVDQVDALYRCGGKDRIGAGASLKKHQGREEALWSVYYHLKNFGLLTPGLQSRFRSRLIHVLLSYRACKGSGEARVLIERLWMARLVPAAIAVGLKVFPGTTVSKRILAGFDLVRKRS